MALPSMPFQVSWGVPDVGASVTGIADALVHCLVVDFQICFQCCLVVALWTFKSQSFVLVVFVSFETTFG